MAMTIESCDTLLTLLDFEDLNRLFGQLVSDSEAIHSGRTLKVLERGFIAIARTDEENGRRPIVGTATILFVSKLRYDFALICDVVVDEKYRSQGIGKLLCSRLIEEGKRRGVKQIDLTSRPERVPANALYKKLGFEERETNTYRLVLA